MLIAHRGVVNEIAKENTIPAFLGAINNPKYDGFELDVYTSLDGVFVVHHDPLIEGKLVTKCRYKELKRKGVVKLEDVLKLRTKKVMLIEIKDINIDPERFRKLICKYKDKNIYVMSFFNSVIKKLNGGDYKVGVLNYVLNSTSVYPYQFIGVLYKVSSIHLVRSLKDLGLEVFIYGIKKEDKLIYEDVYYIVDDY